MRISDWSSDVCSSDLPQAEVAQAEVLPAEVVPAEPGVPAIEDEEDAGIAAEPGTDPRLTALESRLIEAEARSALQAVRGVPELLLPVLRGRLAVAEDGAGGLEIGRASCRGREWQYV